MRRAIILGLLLLGMQLILPLGVPGAAPQALLMFGFLILAAYTVGEIAEGLRLPKILGYLLAGFLVGPPLLGLVPAEVVDELSPISALAVALIAFLAGAELRWSEVRARGVTILKILVVELALSFVAIALLLVLMRRFIPFLAGGDWTRVIVLVALFASVAVVHSPAVTMGILTETHATGPVARTTLGVVLVADVAVVILFSGALGIARSVMPPPGAEGAVSFRMLSWEVVGALIVGAALGGAIALYLRFVKRELFMFAIVVTFFGAAIARLAHVETLLTLLMAGFVAENATRRGAPELRDAMERSAAPVFVVFFALSGAQIAVGDLADLWMVVIPIVLVRAAAIWQGSRLGARWAGASPPEQRYVWMGLISQAGVAIGLAAIMATSYPAYGAQMRSLFLAVLAVNQAIGPVLFRQALVRSGEIAGALGGRVAAVE